MVEEGTVIVVLGKFVTVRTGGVTVTVTLES